MKRKQRVFKFRFWDGETFSYSEIDNEFGCLISPAGRSFIPLVLSGEIETDDIDRDGEDFYTQQFTGLKDKDGQDIYEGDVITLTDKRIIFDNEERHEVIFKDGQFLLFRPHSYLRFRPVFQVTGACKVIGNIFQTPDWLAEEKRIKKLSIKSSKSSVKKCPRCSKIYT